MIGWLQGRLAEPWRQANRCGVLLVCQGVGYEVQLSPRHWQQLPAIGSELELHVHHSLREDGAALYGFPGRVERDLFRELVGVSGVGPQMALGLLARLETPELVRAIVQGDLRRLAMAPGVGKRTAERLAVELRARLQERFAAVAGLAEGDADAALGGVSPPAGGAEELEEVRITLAGLGYETLEIHRALRAVAGEGLETAGAEEWIRSCLRWLSRAAA
jgi:Holliday junction DNA helicase RuvA